MILDPRPRIQLDLRIRLRDGVRLYGALYRPATEDRFPVIYAHTIYSTLQPYYVEAAMRLAWAGYAVLLVDSRGRFESEGEWRPYVCEAADAFDVQQWLAAQPWCDGSIGMFGRSYVGFTQILPAIFRCPAVKALVPMVNQEDNYGHLRLGGVLQLQNVMNWVWIGRRTNQKLTEDGTLDMTALYWKLPLLTALDDVADRPFYREVIRHNRYDDFWKAASLKGRYGEVETPAYFMTGWYDNLVHEGFKCFSGWRRQARTPAARRLSRLLVGPWTHSKTGSAERIGDLDFGHAAAMDLIAEHLRWYDQRLRGRDTGIDAEPPVRIFVMGANAWRWEDDWPLARAECRRFYLASGGRANSLFGDGRLTGEPPATEAPDRFDYDPRDPVPTWGGQSMFLANTGPRDRRSMERRDDVLVYTSDPLPADVEVTGPVELVLYAASSAPDTDFTATLVDVYPGGQAIHLCEGIVRARFRDSYEAPTLLVPGEVYCYRLSLWETSNVFRAGHRIRLEVSSSNFPRFDRNLNTGHEPGLDADLAVARQTIYHDAERSSHLLLPVIAGAPSGE